MSNKIFFHNFFSNNKIWKQIQSNPIAHQYLMPNKYKEIISFRLQDDQDPPVDLPAAHYSQRHRFYGPHPAINYNIRLSDDFAGQTFDVNKQMKKPMTKYQIRQHILDNYTQIPDPANDLPNPRSHGITAAQKLERNLQNTRALLYFGQFRAEERGDLLTRDDYWLPYYKGNFTSLAEKQSRRAPKPHKRDVKFLGQAQYMTPKQKEAYIWLKASE